jgi:hypothetical protein
MNPGLSITTEDILMTCSVEITKYNANMKRSKIKELVDSAEVADNMKTTLGHLSAMVSFSYF